jgi:hypothetical protein
MGMSRREYREFLENFNNWCIKAKEDLNNIFRTGLPYPYAYKEFDTTLQFKKDAAYFIFENAKQYHLDPKYGVFNQK